MTALPSRLPSAFRALLLAACVLGALLPTGSARGAKKTVCTITINSPDEREVMRQRLPPADYDVVELVRRGRPDWLDGACRSGVRCDVLVISGHFDGGTEFYSDRLDNEESLPVDVMERTACSNSCPGVFGGLSEVYLFGCNTLDPAPLDRDPVEIEAALVRGGHPLADAARVARALAERHPRSNRDRMRHLFPEVPVIYGFTAKAPLGRDAGPVLDRFFDQAAPDEVASGRTSAELLRHFAPASMTAVQGLSSTDVDASYRQDLCRFVDTRTTGAQKLEFVRTLVKRNATELRFYVDALERHTEALAVANAESPEASRALAELAGDRVARTQFLAQTRIAAAATTRARMIAIASRLGWLDAAGRHRELADLFAERIASPTLGPADVDLACRLAAESDMTSVRQRLRPSGSDVARASLLACLGDISARSSVLASLASPREQSVELAQVYLHYRPVTDPNEYRTLADAVARMSNPAAQARALHSLSRQPVSDRLGLQALTRLYATAKSADVQRAVAGVLLRADPGELGGESFARTLRTHRVQLADGTDAIDVLIRRLERR